MAVRILTYPDSDTGFTGEVIEILGKAGDPLLDSKEILYQHHIPIEFTTAALQEVEKIPSAVNESEWQGRRDLREKKFVTIDGATARDFDDAVYAEKVSGGFRVWVAIADVSHYVRTGTALDQNAYERGTSVYFPDMVVPMLPEKLSNGLCSLNPHLPRLALVAEMTLDHSGNVTHSDFYEAVFMSHHRMIYAEVEDIVETKKENPKYTDVTPTLNLMADIARILMKKRFNEGSLDLEIPESQVLIDASGIPTDVVRGSRLFAHRLIEELMLLANVCVAKHIMLSGTPSLYRIHEDPFPDALKDLELMAHNWGLRLKFSSGMIQKNLMKMLDHVRGKPEEHILSILILRSMKQAQYSSNNTGHFGLAFPCYTHFTSPIRRYPDLVVHRVLKTLINKSDRINKTAEASRMATIGTFESACEQRAVKAERELITVKKCRFMQRHVGQEMEGMITGLAKFGIFVQLRAYDIDGLIRLETLRGDRFQYNEQTQKLFGRDTGTIVSLGDQVKVKVLRADPDARQIDFEWMDQKHAPAHDGKTNRKDPEERGTPPANRGSFRETWLSKHSGKGQAGPVHPKKNSKKRRNRKAHGRGKSSSRF